MADNESLETSAPVRTSTSYTDREPPPFGHQLLKYFRLDPEYINLNNGSLGSPPGPVIDACKDLVDEIEASPDRFIRLTYDPLWIRCCERLADLIGAERDECVFVPSATHGVDTVLKNFDWKKGDVIIGTNVTYLGVERTIRYLADVNPHVRLEKINIGPPYTHDDLFKSFEATFNRAQSSPEYIALTKRGERPKIVVLFDAITSHPGLLMPWERVVKFCKGHENAWSLIDAAHAIGQIANINLGEIQPDFWISNCHKWLYAKRGCAVLYVPRRNQHIIKSSVPTSTHYISDKEYEQDPTLPKPTRFMKQFSWTGTHDPVPYLSVGPALDFRKWLGGEEKINEYCRSLAIRGGKKLAETIGTEEMDQTPGHALTLNMANVRLPLPKTPKRVAREVIEQFFKRELLFEWKVFGLAFYHDETWWARGCAQVWNEVSDFERLGRAYKELCVQVKEKIIDEKGELRASAKTQFVPSKL